MIFDAGLIVLAALTAAPSEPPTRSPEPPREVVVTGEVVETGCFVMAGRRGEQHKQCALACARAGQPLGLLEDRTGTLFLVVSDRRHDGGEDPLLPFVGEKVEIRGSAADRGGLSALLLRRVRPLAAKKEKEGK